jgi:hypothetical protein
VAALREEDSSAAVVAGEALVAITKAGAARAGMTNALARQSRRPPGLRLACAWF